MKIRLLFFFLLMVSISYLYNCKNEKSHLGESDKTKLSNNVKTVLDKNKEAEVVSKVNKIENKNTEKKEANPIQIESNDNKKADSTDEETKLLKKEKHNNLFDAIKDENFDNVKELVQAGKSVNEKQRMMLTMPLHVAAQEGNLEILKYLVEKGAKVNAQTYMKKSPLHFAVINGNLDCAEYLLNKDAKINVQDIKNLTPLWYAVEGTTINKKDFDKFYAIIELLVQYKSDVNACDYLGDSILKHFKDKGTADPKVLSFLEDNNAVSFSIFKKDVGQLKAIEEEINK